MGILILLLVSGLYAKNFTFVLEDVRDAEYSIIKVEGGESEPIIEGDYRRHLGRTNDGYIHHSFSNSSKVSPSFLSTNFYSLNWSNKVQHEISDYSFINFLSFNEYVKVVRFNTVKFVSVLGNEPQEQELFSLDLVDDIVKIRIKGENQELIKTCSNVNGNFNITEALLSPNKQFISFEVYDTTCSEEHRQRFFIVDLVDNRIQTVYSRKKRAVLQALPANSKWISDTELLYTDEEDGISLYSLNEGQSNTQKIIGDINTGFIVSDFNDERQILLVKLGPEGQQIIEFSLKTNKFKVLYELNWWTKFKYFFLGYRILDPVY